jgi:hypothetical protein
MPTVSPLDELPFPVFCTYCDDGPFVDAIQVDEHITEDHLTEAVWNFAQDFMKVTRGSRHRESRKKINMGGKLIRAMLIEPRFHGDWYVEREYEYFSWLPRKRVWAGKARLLWLCLSLHWVV